ncbi:MAG: resolvase [bacterium (Candidatus Ratteibacteria) CG_4_9_14_3_um_filter_41_21]|uniref:Resolvase n=2 Tax=Candidatus Ratteibacteria TaxID=2979319 RepID=A0A2M7YF13_9BACT|nr:MAG: resolvase [bacterium (Candidatus Ratteibacteria) CG01_land_8_20_14_3_00_40_19]PJA61548.1 MAG: resolvase [bacterium (Candidatus Ratteibacteria) CG_4_9_14_3_um_filter_41_21]
MKLSTYAKKLGLTYKTVWRLWKEGKLDAYQLPTGTVIVREEIKDKLPNKICIYTRVSSSENKDNLKRQAERLKEYAIARGYQIYKIVEEVGSGVNDNRKKLSQILKDKDYNKLIVEHKDRLTRFGFNYISILFNQLGKEIEVVNETDNSKQDLMQDFISIITSFCARLYGLRRSKRKTEKIIKELKDEKNSKI